MAENDFKLPGSSLEELIKIVQAYAQKGDPVTNEEVARMSGVNVGTVSRNNGFLISLGILEGGKKKQSTDLGRALGRALLHEQSGEAARLLREAVSRSSFLSEQLTAVRVQRGVKKEDLPGKILYNADASKNKHTEAGARAVVDLLVAAGLLAEADGGYEVAKSEGVTPVADTPGLDSPPPAAGVHDRLLPDDTNTSRVDGSRQAPFQVAINLQLQLPEFDDPQRYDGLFAALRKHFG